MDVKYEFENEPERRIVYVRAVAVDDLPSEVQAQTGGLDHIFALHDADGERIALVRDRRLAFALARQNDMSPVSVH